MKKIISLFVLVFSLAFVADVKAQTYEPAPFWGTFPNMKVARQLPWELHTVMVYDFPQPVVRRVSISISQPFPEYTPLYEEILFGQGVDTVRLTNLSNFGYTCLVTLLDQSYNLIQSYVLYTGAFPASDPVVTTTGGQDLPWAPSLYSTQVQSQIGYGGTIPSGQFTQKFYCKLWQDPSGYAPNEQSFNFPWGPGPAVASFVLPLDFTGKLCLRWRLGVTHNSNTPKYWEGESTVWKWQACFLVGDIHTGMEELGGAEFGVYPNPWRDVLCVRTTNPTSYNIFDMEGKIVYQGRLSVGTNVLVAMDFTPGQYILRTDDGQTARLVKE